MKKAVLFGNGLSAELFLYCLMSKMKEEDISVEVHRASLGSVKQPHNNIRACFYIHKYLDINLTPQETLINYRFRVVGQDSPIACLNYDEKVFGIQGMTDAHERIKDVNSQPGVKEYFCGKTFCQNLVKHGRRLTGELTLSGQLKIIDHGEVFPKQFINTNSSDIIVQAEPLYRLVNQNAIYEDSGSAWMEDFLTYPIGVKVESMLPHEPKPMLESPLVDIQYDVNLDTRYYRTVTDHQENILISEYSLAYKDNNIRLYNGGVIYPGKIIKNDMTQDWVNNWTREFGPMFFCGRYAAWCPDITMTDVYGSSIEIIERFIC